MKKILFSILCAGAVISCAKEVVITADQEAITFESAFVDKATKVAYDGSYNTDNLSEFQVYATITGTGSNEGTANIFEGERVVKGSSLGQGTNWSYAVTNTQYWIPGNNYQFRAVADGNVSGVTEVVTDTDGMATAINLLDASAQKDILTAQHNVTNYTKPTSGTPTPVAFTFDHILAKAKFTVKNTITTDNGYNYKVYNLSVNDVAKNGVYTFGTGWSAAATPETYNLAFGHAVVDGTAAGVATPAVIGYNGSVESNYDRLLVPTVAEDLNVSFTYELLKGDVVIDTQDKSLNTGALTLVSGSSYNFVISLGNPGDPIQFDVEKVNDWDERVPVILEPVEVASADELVAAISNGESVVLTQNIDLDALSTRATAYAGLTINNDVVIDGNGFTLTSGAVRAINIVGAKEVSIKNATIVVADNGETHRAINIEGANHIVNLENVTATASYYTVNLVGTADNCVVNIKDSNISGLIPVNVWGENSVVNVQNTVLTCLEESADEAYAAIQINANGVDNATNAVVNVKGGEIVAEGANFGGAISAAGAQINFDGTKGNLTIEGEPFVINYGDMHYSFSTFAEAYETAKAGETILFTQDVTVESHLTINKNITLDLNGKTLSVDLEGSTDGDDAIWVRDNAEVLITNGTVQVVNSLPEMTYGSALFATGTSKLTIENLNVIGAGEAVFAQSNAQVVINSGSFKSTEHPEFTLNLRDRATDSATILVNGGSFYKYNPAESKSENPVANFVAEGKTVEQNGDWYIVK